MEGILPNLIDEAGIVLIAKPKSKKKKKWITQNNISHKLR